MNLTRDFLARWKTLRKKIISCLKKSSKYILIWMLIFCFKFFHVHDLSFHCQHHYLILPVSSMQPFPSFWCMDHAMAGCGWQEHWRGKMWLGSACFSVTIPWVLCFQQWGDTQQKVGYVSGARKAAEVVKCRIHSPFVVDNLYLALSFISLLCPPPPCPGHGVGLIHHCSHCPFCYTCHFCPAKHLLHEAYGHAWIMSYLGRNSRSCGRCLSSGKISQPPTAHGRINLGICMELH